MKVTLKDLLRHKFPMDETEQAVLLKEISDLAKELREILDDLKECPTEHEFLMMNFIREILGES